MRSEIIVTKEIVLVLTVSELELLVRDLSSIDMLESLRLLKDFEAILSNLNIVSTANSECR